MELGDKKRLLIAVLILSDIEHPLRQKVDRKSVADTVVDTDGKPCFCKISLEHGGTCK